MDALWRIELLGGLRAVHVDRVVSRFRTQRTGVLLAYLAYYQDRAHPREALIEQVWPACEPEEGRHSLSVALSSLRRQLEPPGIPVGSVIMADRTTVRLNPDAVTTDVREFDALTRRAAGAAERSMRIELLTRAVEQYSGPLLVGYYDDWILLEQVRLAETLFGAISDLIAELEAMGRLQTALRYARHAVRLDPLREEAHRGVMRLLGALGEPGAALRQYRDLEEILGRELGLAPSRQTRELARALKDHAGQGCATAPARGQPAIGRLPRASAASPPSSGRGGDPRHRRVRPARREARAPSSERWDVDLPAQFTRFFGREQEIAALTALLSRESSGRLVTLTGTGGCGKTRLAVAVAEQIAGQEIGTPSPRAIRFVPLADLPEALRIPEAIRDALRLPRGPEQNLQERIVLALSRRPTLLLLDNFEHLVEEGASLVRRLLERVPTLVCVVTSRRRLGLEGEREFPVPPLPTPVDSCQLTVDSERRGQDVDRRATRLLLSELSTVNCQLITAFPSVQLFVDRAQAVKADFQVTRANAEPIAALCRRLEGIPLALELAAARAQVLTPAQMLTRLEQRFDLLVSHRRNLPARHRSLRAAIEWSVQLLSPALRRFFARLSAFRGGWTLDAVEYVCETPDALDCLEQLREYSLVLTEEAGEETRYRTLESVREYACTLLSSEEGTALSRKHAAYFTILAERAAPELRGQSQASWLRGLEAERENIGAALDWLLASRDIEGGLRLASALARFWNMHGYSREGRQRLAALLAGARDLDSAGARTQAVSPAILAAAIDAAGTLAHDLGEYQEARRLHEEGLAIRRRLGDLKGVSASLHNLGTVSVAEGDYSVAQAFLEESLAIRRERDDRVGIAAALGHLGYVAHCQGDVLTAERRLQESVAISRELGDRWGMAGSLYLLGHLALSRGEEETAGRLFHEELAIERELGDPQGIAGALHSLGSVLRRQAAYEAASALYEESLAIQRGLGDQPGVATSLCSLGQVALSQGNLDAAKSLLEEALGLWRSLGARRGIAWATELLGEVAREQGELESASALLAESLKTRRELGDRTGVLVSVEALAKVASARDEPERATRLFGATASWRAARGTALPPNEQPDRDARLLALRKALGESAFDAAWCAGGALTEDEAIADALGPDPGRAAPVPDPADRDLTDVQWELLRPLLPPRAKEGRPRAEDRQTLNGILYVLRTGCRWQDMPPRYGSPVTCWRRLTQWRASGTWDRLALALLESLAPASREEWSRVLQR